MKMERVKELDLRELLRACLRKWWLILLCAVVAGVAVYLYTMFFVTPLYRTGASFYVNNSQQSESQKISSSDLATSQRLVLTYVNIIKSDTVLEKVIAEADLKMTPGQIRGMMTAQSMDDTEMFKVQITNKDPYLATRVANAIATVAPAEIAGILVGSTTKVVDRAKVPTAPYTPNRSRNAVMGAAAGAAIAVIYVALTVLMDVRIKSDDDLAAICSAPVLGMVPDFFEDGKAAYASAKNNNNRKR